MFLKKLPQLRQLFKCYQSTGAFDRDGLALRTPTREPELIGLRVAANTAIVIEMRISDGLVELVELDPVSQFRV